MNRSSRSLTMLCFVVAGMVSAALVTKTALAEECIPASFVVATTIAAEDEANAVAAADFNLDGKPDLAVANFRTDNLTVVLGDGSGGFSPAAGSPVSAGGGPESVAAGDFNRDGKPDLAVANVISDNVTILLGDGSGGFSAAAGTPVGVGDGPFSLAAGDFNRDGKLDLVTANFVSGTVTILLGNGSGGFTEAFGSPVRVGDMPLSVAVADFNFDEKPDVAVGKTSFGTGTVSILIGNGGGGFSEATGSPLGVGNFLTSVTVGDLNLDDRPDLVVTIGAGIMALLGDGSGSFSPTASSPVAAGVAPASVEVGDFNLEPVMHFG